MADAFGHPSGMAQSHSGGSTSVADRYVKARPPTPRPTFDALYPERDRILLHRETKTHVSGGVHRIDYEVVEDRKAKCLIIAPYYGAKATRCRAVFLSLPKLYDAFDSLDQKPWVKQADAAVRDVEICKFVMSRLQFSNVAEWPTFGAADSPALQLEPAPHAVFVPRSGSAADAELEISQPAAFNVAMLAPFEHALLLLVEAANATLPAPAEPPAPAPAEAGEAPPSDAAPAASQPPSQPPSHPAVAARTKKASVAAPAPAAPAAASCRVAPAPVPKAAAKASTAPAAKAPAAKPPRGAAARKVRPAG